MNDYQLSDSEVRILQKTMSKFLFPAHEHNIRLYYPIILRYLRRPHNYPLKQMVHFDIIHVKRILSCLVGRFENTAYEIQDSMGGMNYFSRLPILLLREDLNKNSYYSKRLIVYSLLGITVKFYWPYMHINSNSTYYFTQEIERISKAGNDV